MKSFQGQLRKLMNSYCALIKRHELFLGNFYFIRFVWFKFLGLVLCYEVLCLFKKNIIRQDESHEDTKGISFDEATQDDYDAIMSLNPNRPDNFIGERLENKEMCYVARSCDEKFCAYFWVAPGKRVFKYRSREILIDDHDVYIRDIQTLPDYRGRGITPKFLKWINTELFKKGKKIMWAAIKGLNYSSQRSFKKAGFCIDEKIYYATFPLIKKNIIFSRKRTGC